MPPSINLPPAVELARFSNRGFDRGAGVLKEGLWLVVSLLLFRLCPFSFSPVKRFVLRLFGARLGRGVVIKPQVKITFPWKLEAGDHVWLGEECWLLNLERISLGDNVCVSQRAFLCTGSHNYKRQTFDLLAKPIRLEAGAWAGAGCWVAPGVTFGTHAILTAGSVATGDLRPWGIYQGNPAVRVRERSLASAANEGYAGEHNPTPDAH